MIRITAILALAATLITSWAPSAAAHKSSDSYLSLDLQGDRIVGQWDLSLRDLDYAIGLDSDDDGILTWGEVRAHHDAIAAFALAGLTISADDHACAKRVTGHLVDQHSDGAYEILRFTVDCSGQFSTLDVKYSLLFNLDPQHRGLLRLTEHGRTHSAVLSPDQNDFQFTAGQTIGLGRQFLDYFHEGVWHIWTGFDHILFLSSLLLPAVLTRRAGQWQAVATFREAFFEILRIVSAFTLAHSITLSLAVLGFIDLPSRLIESAIAASVVLAALNNIYPLIIKRLWLVAFGFGLVHGLGFANVLRELGLPRDALAVSLVSFNLGVEAGQMAIVAAFLPLAFFARRSWAYPRVVLGGGSICIVGVASFWLIERCFNIVLL